MTKQEEFELYGKYLDGTETELEKAKLARIRYLKMKMRDRLAANIGDDPDALTDVLRCVLICQAINLGIVSDEDIVARHAAYISEMLDGYGGAAAIMDVLEYDKAMIGQHVALGYFAAKAMVDAATTPEDVMMIDLPEGE
jgi:arginyl-tRNA--protein-N-Asp/Glu arginylyltransferase